MAKKHRDPKGRQTRRQALDRGSRDGGAKGKAVNTRGAREQPTSHHSRYGEIPLVEQRSVGLDGREWIWWRYDPNYEPPLPRGAIRGNVALQQYCVAHDVPKYFYLDEERTCVQCGLPFVFWAKEQKYWYEKLKFNFNSVAVRCRDCRRKKRTESALRHAMAAALAQLKARPGDPHLLLDLARATVQYFERTGQGDLNRAISACRKATEREQRIPEAIYWEARAQQLAGRDDRARSLYATFLAEARGRPRLHALVNAAERHAK